MEGGLLEEALGPERVRLRVVLRARVGEPDRRRHVGARGEREPVDVEVGGEPPAGERHDRAQPQRLRDDRAQVRGRRSARARASTSRMMGEQVQRPRQPGGRRLVARDQQRHQLVADLAVVHAAPSSKRAPTSSEQMSSPAVRPSPLGDLGEQQLVDLLAPSHPGARAAGGGRTSPTPAGWSTWCPPAGRAAAARRRSRSATPNTARRITSSVIACMLGCTGNARPSGHAGELALRRLAHHALVGAHPLAVERRQHQPPSREVLLALQQQQRARADQRLQRDLAARRQPVPALAVQRADDVGPRDHDERRAEALEADAEHVAVAAPAVLEEPDRPRHPARGLQDRRLRGSGGQRGHTPTVPVRRAGVSRVPPAGTECAGPAEPATKKSD